MSGGTPKVSVIMPAYNAARFIRESVESVLSQSYGNVELVVIDDGSTDSTAEALGAYRDRIKLVKQRNGGPSAARNRGLERATGDYVCFLDADDLMCPGAMEAFITRALENPAADVVVGRWDTIDEKGRGISTVQEPEKGFSAPKNDGVKALLLGCCLGVPATTMARLQAVRECGGWDESLWCAEDRDLWLRLALAKRQFDFIPFRVARYRKHPANSTRNIGRMEEHLLRFLNKWFERPVPVHKDSDAMKPYAFALGWLYLARQSEEAGLETEMRRCVRSARGWLAKARPNEELALQVLWDAYEKPWEREVHSALWVNSKSSVAELCWIHGRQALRRHNLTDAWDWFLALAKNDPGHFGTKLRRLFAA